MHGFFPGAGPASDSWRTPARPGSRVPGGSLGLLAGSQRTWSASSGCVDRLERATGASHPPARHIRRCVTHSSCHAFHRGLMPLTSLAGTGYPAAHSRRAALTRALLADAPGTPEPGRQAGIRSCTQGEASRSTSARGLPGAGGGRFEHEEASGLGATGYLQRNCTGISPVRNGPFGSGGSSHGKKARQERGGGLEHGRGPS
jgi:hypothetical protein